MKKLVQLSIFFAVACCVLTGCDKTTNSGADRMSITLSAGSYSIFTDSEGQITVKTSRALKIPLVVHVASDNASVAVPETITIEAGKNVATGIIKGVSLGSAKITITAEDVNYITQSIDIEVVKVTADTPMLTITMVSPEILKDAVVPFTVTCSKTPLSDLTVNLTSDKPEIASVPASVLIRAGNTAVDGEITGVALGKAVISMAAVGAVPTAPFTVTVATADLFANLVANGKLIPPGTSFVNLIGESNVYGKVYPGTLYYHEFDKLGGTPTGIFKSAIDPYGGDAVGVIVDDEVFFTSYEEGTVIDDNLPWQIQKTTRMRFPILVKNGDAVNSLPDGTHFIVLALPREGDPYTTTGWDAAVNLPCWLKIKVEGLNIEVLDGVMVLDKKTPFKVGQK